MYTKESIERLKGQVDIVDLVGGYVQLKGAGTMHKGLCPFHQEKTPSFTVTRASSHYHCFGCGAHGDPIAFLMNYLSLSFVEAVEVLAEKYSVRLEEQTKDTKQGPSKTELREANKKIASFFTTYLLSTNEGSRALEYVYGRGMDLDFISTFSVGMCPQDAGIFLKACKSLGINPYLQQELGLLKNGKPLFLGRIVFPITDQLGHVVGFSGRKLTEESFGPKYINTPETQLFKKSHLLYGLDRSRKRIAKEKKALIVEGQIDTLRLIQEGFTFVVAGQGTAFTEGQAKLLLDLGVEKVYLGMDGDTAGREAAIKIGDLFQREGVEVYILRFSDGEDPDAVLREEGPEGIITCMSESVEYLRFLVEWHSKGIDTKSPSGKTHLVQKIAKQVKAWDNPLMVHESLRKLAELTHVPENLVGVGKQEDVRSYYIQKTASLQGVSVDPDRVLETDLLRWLFFAGDHQDVVAKIIFENISSEHLNIAVCRRVFTTFLDRFQKGEPVDLLSVGASLENSEDQLFLSEVTSKRVNTEKVVEGAEQTTQRVLERHWFAERERIRVAIQSGQHTDEEVFELAKQFDALKRSPPKLLRSEEEQVQS